MPTVQHTKVAAANFIISNFISLQMKTNVYNDFSVNSREHDRNRYFRSILRNIQPQKTNFAIALGTAEYRKYIIPDDLASLYIRESHQNAHKSWHVAWYTYKIAYLYMAVP